MSETGPVDRAGCGPRLRKAAENRPLRLQVFEAVRSAGCLPRAEIARALGISAASVTAVTAELILDGFLEEVPATPPRDAARGRPPVGLAVTGGAGFVIGLKLSDEAHTAILADFAGTILAEIAHPASSLRKPSGRILAELEHLVAALLAQAGLTLDQVAGVGIGITGMVDHQAGAVLWSPILDGRGLNLRDAAQDRLGRPVFVDNDANLLTLSELWFGAGRELDDFAVVTIENGVGMGVVIDSALYRGARGTGLELGHTKVQLDGALCRCGRRGCLEAYLADYALAREAATALGHSIRAEHSPDTLLDALGAAARAGDDAAQSIFWRAGRYLAIGLSNVIQIFDPELIIVSSDRLTRDHADPGTILRDVEALSPAGRRPGARVEIRPRGDFAWARGGAALALSTVTGQALERPSVLPIGI